MDDPCFLFEKELKTQANRNILILSVVHLQYFIIHTIVFFKRISYHHDDDVTCIKRKMLEKSAAAAAAAKN